MTIKGYPAHEFNALDAAALDGKIATVSTHANFFCWEQTYADVRVRFLTGDMHITVRRVGRADAAIEITFEDVASVEIHGGRRS